MTVASNLWHPPETPHAYDDEFNADALDAKWSAMGTVSASAISVTAQFATAEARRDINTHRRSWLRLQNSSDSLWRGVVQTPSVGVELPDGTYWARGFQNWRFANLVNNDGACALGLVDSQYGGAEIMEGDGILALFTEKDTGTVQPQFDRWTGGAVLTVQTLSDMEGLGATIQFMALVKTGLTFECFAGSQAGQWVRMASTTYAGGGVIDSIALATHNNQQAAPGNMIAGFDFFRYRADGELP